MPTTHAIYSRNRRPGTFARKLARGLGISVLSPRSPMGRDMTLINWGCSTPPTQTRGSAITWLLNTPETVGHMADKRMCFDLLRASDIPTVSFTHEVGVAQTWLNAGYPVYERHILTGHSGAGINLLFPDTDQELGIARLYTRGISREFDEYRIHILNDAVLFTQQKRRMGARAIEEHGFEIPDNAIRNAIRTYANGWVFATQNVQLPVAAEQSALAAMRACGAESGCVDLAVDARGAIYVFELNSAPALRSDHVYNSYLLRIRELLLEGTPNGS